METALVELGLDDQPMVRLVAWCSPSALATCSAEAGEHTGAPATRASAPLALRRRSCRHRTAATLRRSLPPACSAALLQDVDFHPSEGLLACGIIDGHLVLHGFSREAVEQRHKVKVRRGGRRNAAHCASCLPCLDLPLAQAAAPPPCRPAGARHQLPRGAVQRRRRPRLHGIHRRVDPGCGCGHRKGAGAQEGRPRQRHQPAGHHRRHRARLGCGRRRACCLLLPLPPLAASRSFPRSLRL